MEERQRGIWTRSKFLANKRYLVALGERKIHPVGVPFSFGYASKKGGRFYSPPRSLRTRRNSTSRDF